MKNTKKCFVMFSFYDRTGIEKYLEKQAQEGWLLDKTSAFGWHFHRIQPQKIHFSVSYFPKASSFDPEPSQQQKSFHDFCEHTGWKLAASSAQMQIFYNEQAEPIPIETDAVMEVEQIHAAAKKSYLPNYAILIASGLLQAGIFGWRLFSDPLSILASNANLFTIFCWLLMLLISFSEVIRYYSWHKRALRMAELDGSFTETKGHTNYQIIALCLMLIAFAFLLISYGGSKMSLIALVTIAVIFGITAIVIGLSELMKKLKLSAKANRNATIIITLLLSFGFTGFLLVGVMNQVTALWPDKVPAYSYEYNGFTRAVYDDKLPLTVEDLIEIDYDGYSYELRRADNSVLVERIEAIQRPQLDALENPDLEYTITSVKLPLLYNWCKAALLDNFAHNYGRPVPEDDMWEKHMNIDPQPWGANEAYQLWLGDEPEMRFLLCYDDRIIEIDFEYDWVLTQEQMKTIGEKLNN